MQINISQHQPLVGGAVGRRRGEGGEVHPILSVISDRKGSRGNPLSGCIFVTLALHAINIAGQNHKPAIIKPFLVEHPVHSHPPPLPPPPPRLLCSSLAPNLPEDKSEVAGHTEITSALCLPAVTVCSLTVERKERRKAKQMARIWMRFFHH